METDPQAELVAAVREFFQTARTHGDGGNRVHYDVPYSVSRRLHDALFRIDHPKPAATGTADLSVAEQARRVRLRHHRTGCGLMEGRIALKEAGWDLDAAIRRLLADRGDRGLR